jgi:hypothetical protein
MNIPVAVFEEKKFGHAASRATGTADNNWFVFGDLV